MKTNRASEWHSQTGECRGRDKSGHGNTQPAKGTHILETSQGTKKTRESESTHSPGLDSAEGGTSQQKQIEQAGGTHFLESAEEGHVRKWKQTERSRGTHPLESTGGETSQDTDTIGQATCTHILESAER